MKKLLSLLLLASVLWGCSRKQETHGITRAFYYWKSDYFRGESDLSELGVTKLYVKFFEVDFSDEMGAFPIEKTRFDGIRDTARIEVVPTVFIRNEVFLHLRQGEIDTLASNVKFLIDKYSRTNGGSPFNTKEWQFDCDWTPKSRDNYFRFLKKMKSISGKETSCTLRLYPYKYRTIMGVPPVDRAMLMCYNLIHPLSDKRRNSILDNNELKAYLTIKEKYPLPLDIALPVFSWLHLYQNNRFANLIDANTKSLGKSIQPVKKMWYRVVKDTTLDYDLYLRQGDFVKAEEVTAAQLSEAQKILSAKLQLEADFTVSFFDYDPDQPLNFTNDEIEKIYSGFAAPEL